MSNPNEPLPDFSDVEGGSSSASMPEAEATAQYQMYTVKGGDSLSKIARHLYGDGDKWKSIWEANKDSVKNPDLIQPGWSLKIPD